ncbi:MAG TPA: tRNA preQ1(34) S-adenosylmethionine ribosyltransferase-isomerase QueA [Verrucomicrobiae bacterium]|nr:tRNA preQ1(34) S-adenosylmethionine ribosyltransferase-isomerase QueA [Verrucomicrobiae bacterium]
MKTSDFDYALPQELIAQVPAPQRDKSRLMVVDRLWDTITHKHFVDLLHYLKAGDVLVMNNSKVIPARLRARNAKTGGHFEILLVDVVGTNHWWAMMRPGKRARVGTELQILDKSQNPSCLTATVLAVNEEGHRRLRFSGVPNLLTELDNLGELPLPPYIERTAPSSSDAIRYQTVYAEPAGSVAAPTAGLHFTDDLLEKIRDRGVKTCFVTLHVGLGTFNPIKTEKLYEHIMHYEWFAIPPETARAVSEAKANGRRVIAVGTTTVRVLEGAKGTTSGRTNIFIHPPHPFNMVDALVTNFHLPRSTLLMLVSAFADPGGTRGRELILRAYEEAIARRYRFFSYGDAMLIV